LGGAVKRTPLKRKPWRRALGTAEQRLRFKQAVLEADGHRCVYDKNWFGDDECCDGPLQAAHVIRKHTLRKRGYGADVVYSVDAAFTLCRTHHQLHDSYALRVPDSLIPERCREFAKAAERSRETA
jgi:HNH endonuclease